MAAERLQLDFLVHPPSSGRAWLMLGAAVLLALALLVRQAAAPAPPPLPDAPVNPAAGNAAGLAFAAGRASATDERRMAQAAMAQIALPWAQLIEWLEAAALPGVALLAVQPDADGGQLRLRGETGSERSLFAYLRRLEASGLRAVHLLSHEVDPQAAPERLRFTVQAAFPAAAPGAAAPSPDAFHARLPPRAALTAELEKLHALAGASKASLPRGEYRLEARGPLLLAYRVDLPVEGAWPALRAFIGEVLAEMPSASLDAMRFERGRASEAALRADLRFTLHFHASGEKGD